LKDDKSNRGERREHKKKLKDQSTTIICYRWKI